MGAYSAPPLPPGITSQQSALGDYAQAGAGVSASPDQTTQQFNSMDLVASMLNDVTQKLENVAKILVQDRPHLVAYLKPAVNGIVMLVNEIQASKGNQQGAPAGAKQQVTQAAMQEPQSAAGAISA